MKIFGIVVAFLIVVFVLGFVFTGMDFAQYKFWAPKYEAARRQVFENTPSYVQGKISHLSLLRADYEAAQGIQRESLRRLILSEASTVNQDLLPPELAIFVHRLQENLENR